jgi:hypothetical protein
MQAYGISLNFTLNLIDVVKNVNKIFSISIIDYCCHGTVLEGLWGCNL